MSEVKPVELPLNEVTGDFKVDADLMARLSADKTNLVKDNLRKTPLTGSTATEVAEPIDQRLLQLRGKKIEGN